MTNNIYADPRRVTLQADLDKHHRLEIDRPHLTDRQKRILRQLHAWLVNESKKKPGPDGQHVLRMWGWEVDELEEATRTYSD